MKRNILILTACALALALLLVAIAYLYDRQVDRDRLAQAAASPNHTAPALVQTEPSEGAEATAPKKDFAPEFTVFDKDGKPVKLADFRGKPVVICFWTSWQDACKQQLPIIQAAYDDYKDTVHFLLINMPDGTRETKETAQAFLAERGYTFPVYYDTDSVAAINYNVQSTPSTYFIDEEGRGMAYAGGKINRVIFEKGLARCYHDD